MTIGCNIMICLKLNWFFYGLSRMLQFSQFLWPLSYSVWDVFNNFLLIDATDRSKISRDHHSIFFDVSLYTPFHFSRTLQLSIFVVVKNWLFSFMVFGDLSISCFRNNGGFVRIKHVIFHNINQMKISRMWIVDGYLIRRNTWNDVCSAFNYIILFS